MSGAVPRSWRIREAAADARGSSAKNQAVIRSGNTRRTRYWVNATKSPGVILPSMTMYPPSQRTARVPAAGTNSKMGTLADSDHEQFDGPPEDPVGGPVHSPHRLGLSPKGLDHPDPADSLLDHAGEIGQSLLDIERESGDTSGVSGGEQEQHRYGERGDDAQQRVEQDQHDDRYRHQADVGHGDGEHGENQADLGQVGRGPGHQFAGRHPVVETEGQPLDVLEQPVAEIGFRPV